MDQEIYEEINAAGDSESLTHRFALYASENPPLTPGKVQAAYYRHKKIVDEVIDSKAPVSDSKPLRDGTEGDSITSIRASVEVLMDDAFQFYQNLGSLLVDLDDIQQQMAGTKNMSRLAKELGL